MEHPCRVLKASLPGFLQRGLFCLMESMFACSFSNATFSSDGIWGI